MGTLPKSNLKLLISRRKIKKIVRRLAREIRHDYSGKDFVLICVLKGAFHFCSDLSRAIAIEHEVFFIVAHSYEGTESSGKVHFPNEFKESIAGRHIIVVDDIADTGNTLFATEDHLRSLDWRNPPASLEFCTLFGRKGRSINPKYLGRVMKGWLVGYGLDNDGKDRWRDYVSILLNPT